MQILSGIFDDQLTVLSGSPFFSIINNYKSRVFHYHNCIEFTYVLSGSGEQIIILPDGQTKSQKLSKGNYTIIDTTVKHAYVNGSDDFILINLLFHSSFLFDNSQSRAFQNAFCVSMSSRNDNNYANEIEVNFELKKHQVIGDNNYIRLWMDLKENSQEIDFFNMRIGLIVNGDISAPYFYNVSEKTPFYFLREGEKKWIPIHNARNGYFKIDNCSGGVGFPGWFAFSIDKMCQEKTGRFLSKDDLITGVAFFFFNMSGKHFYIDDIKFVENYDGGVKNILYDNNRVFDFDDGLLNVAVVDDNAKLPPQMTMEQTSVLALEPENFYELVKEAYPEFDYEKIFTTNMDLVFYDKDARVLPLFQMCHQCYTENWHEWNQMVKNGLSLIMLSALQSIVSGDKLQKENIIDIVKNYVDIHYAENLTLAEICENNFYNASYISRRFKEVTNCTFEQYLRQVRIKHAGEMLLCTNLTINEIGEKCGYTSIGAFRKAFVAETGKKPLEFKKTYKDNII